jgi:hypothetical protein
MATLFLLALVAGAIGFLFQKLAAAKEKEHDDLEPQVAVIQDKGSKMRQANDRLQHTQGEANQICSWMEGRYYWGDILTELRGALIRSEDEVRKKYAAQKPGMEAGIWIEQMTTGTAAPAAPAENGAAQPPPEQNTNTVITLVCRAVDLTQMDPTADNTEIVYAVERELKAAPVFDPKTVQSAAQISPVDAAGTFTFTITVVPQTPLRL